MSNPARTPSGRLQTCYGCEHCKLFDWQSPMLPFGVWGCTAAEGGIGMVPQSTTKERTIFKRVPLECPLPASKVNKRPENAPLRPDLQPVVLLEGLESEPLAENTP